MKRGRADIKGLEWWLRTIQRCFCISTHVTAGSQKKIANCLTSNNKFNSIIIHKTANNMSNCCSTNMHALISLYPKLKIPENSIYINQFQ